jgi:hypothetical protein
MYSKKDRCRPVSRFHPHGFAGLVAGLASVCLWQICHRPFLLLAPMFTADAHAILSQFIVKLPGTCRCHGPLVRCQMATRAREIEARLVFSR